MSGSTLPENRGKGTPQLLLQLSLAHELCFLLSLSLLHAVVKARLDWRSHAGTVPRYLLIARAACAHACILAQARRQKPPRKQARRRSPRLHVWTPVLRRTAGARWSHGYELLDAHNEKCRRAGNRGHPGMHIRSLPRSLCSASSPPDLQHDSADMFIFSMAFPPKLSPRTLQVST